MDSFIHEFSLAQLLGISLYYNHSYNKWFAARTGLVSTGIELIHTFKKTQTWK